MTNNRSLQTGFSEATDGRGQPVLVIPGFLNNDAYMRPLHSKLSAQGYQVHGWACGLNMGPSQKVADSLEKRLKQIYEESGGKKVSLIGYSQGGIYARELARKYPDFVLHVITMGTPFGMKDSRVSKVHNLFNAQVKDQDINQIMITPPPVSTLSIYSKNDGFVDWQACLNAPAPNASNVEVVSSHIRMPFDEATHRVLFDFLAKPAYVATPTPRADRNGIKK